MVVGLLIVGALALQGCGGGGTPPPAVSTESPERPANQMPRVQIAASVTEGASPLEVSFTAEASDADGAIASYHWDFGDNQSSQEQNPTHKFEQESAYTVKLTVTDNDGAAATAEVTITVKASGGGTKPAEGAVHIVKMISDSEKNYFEPAELTIKVGETVRFVNESGAHSATAQKIPAGAEAFDSGLLTAPGQVYEQTFTVAGEYEFVCAAHEVWGMKGKIIVTP